MSDPIALPTLEQISDQLDKRTYVSVSDVTIPENGQRVLHVFGRVAGTDLDDVKRQNALIISHFSRDWRRLMRANDVESSRDFNSQEVWFRGFVRFTAMVGMKGGAEAETTYAEGHFAFPGTKP